MCTNLKWALFTVVSVIVMLAVFGSVVVCH
ncbi:cytochrome bd-I oxidase subunit CydH [Orbus mooreae]